MATGAPHVRFGQVTIIIVERIITPPPSLLKVPNPYIRHPSHPFEHIQIDDAISMVLQWTREMANRQPDLTIPPE